MKKTAMNYKITFILFIISASLFAQRPNREFAGKNMSQKGILIGHIIDESASKPMAYVNVGLYNVRDSSLVTGAITDNRGWFKLNDIPYGKYYLEAKFIGFEKETIEDIVLRQAELQLPDIQLETSTTKLGEIEVVEQRNHIDYKLEKKIVNVSQDLNSTGGTAVDVLENTPSVETDIDGNVSLRGTSNFVVLVDGKPSIFEGSDALQMIPASTIENIEIITNPSVRYDPDGVGGIINVVTKKNYLKGITGIVDLSVGTRDKYGADVTLSYKNGKYNIFGGINYSDNTHYGNRMMDRESFLNDTMFYMNTWADRNRVRARSSIKAGIDYYLNPTSTLTFSTRLGRMGYERNSDADYYEYSDPLNFEEYYVSENLFSVYRQYIQFNVDYSKHFLGEGHQLDVSFSQSFEDGHNDSEVTEQFTTEDWNTVTGNSLLQTIYEGNIEKETRFKADYVRPINKDSKFEAGYQLRLDLENETYDLEQFDSITKVWIAIDAYKNDMDFTRSINSVYSIYSGRLSFLEFQAGLRAEYTNRLITQNIINQEYLIDRLDWFPTLHLSMQINDNYQAQASYGRRINRPRSWYLDPFVTYIDPLNIRVGNAALGPEYIDSYELNLQRKLGKSFVSVESYFRQTNDLISRTRTLNDDNIMVHTFSNLDRDYSLGFEIMLNLQLFKWWRLNAATNIFRYQVEGNVGGDDLVQTSNTWSERINSTFIIKKNTRIQLTGYYSGPSVTVQGERDGFFFTNIGVKQDFWDRKASVTLQVRDVFGTMKHSFTSEGNNFYLYNEFSREPRVVTLQFTYMINNYTKKDRNGGNGSMDFDDGDM
jgi:outer membrane receptor protein involved in Fe transport